MAGNVIGGIGNAALSIGCSTLLQTSTEASYLTRVFGLYSPAITGASLPGSWVGGLLTEATDVRFVYLGAGSAVLVASLGVLHGSSSAFRPRDVGRVRSADELD